jgi:hypothetical protein
VPPADTVALIAPGGTKQKSTAVPESASVCEPAGSLSEIFNTLFCTTPVEPHGTPAAGAGGLNVTGIMHAIPAANPDLQLLVSVKSAEGVSDAPLTVKIAPAPPEFVIVTFCGALAVPASCGAKVIAFAGVTAAVACTAEPLKLTFCGLPGALSAI